MGCSNRSGRIRSCDWLLTRQANIFGRQSRNHATLININAVNEGLNDTNMEELSMKIFFMNLAIVSCCVMGTTIAQAASQEDHGDGMNRKSSTAERNSTVDTSGGMSISDSFDVIDPSGSSRVVDPSGTSGVMGLPGTSGGTSSFGFSSGLVRRPGH